MQAFPSEQFILLIRTKSRYIVLKGRINARSHFAENRGFPGRVRADFHASRRAAAQRAWQSRGGYRYAPHGQGHLLAAIPAHSLVTSASHVDSYQLMSII